MEPHLLWGGMAEGLATPGVPRSEGYVIRLQC